MPSKRRAEHGAEPPAFLRFTEFWMRLRAPRSLRQCNGSISSWSQPPTPWTTGLCSRALPRPSLRYEGHRTKHTRRLSPPDSGRSTTFTPYRTRPIEPAHTGFIRSGLNVPQHCSSHRGYDGGSGLGPPSRMVQGILIMPLAMHKPLRFSVINSSLSPIIPPSRFYSL